MALGDFGSVLTDQVLVAGVVSAVGDNNRVQPTISHVRGDVFCAVYASTTDGSNFSVQLRTFTISPLGVVSAVIGSATVIAASIGRKKGAVIRHSTDGIIGISTNDPGDTTFRLFTFNINADGTIVGQVDTLTMTGTTVRGPRTQVRLISDTVVAAAYVDGTQLRITTVSIDSAGNLGAELATLTVGTANATSPDRITDLQNAREDIWVSGRSDAADNLGNSFIDSFTINPTSGAITSLDTDQIGTSPFHPGALVALAPDDDGMLGLVTLIQQVGDTDQLRLFSEDLTNLGILSGVLDSELFATGGTMVYAPGLSLGNRGFLINEENVGPSNQRTYTVDGPGTITPVGVLTGGTSFSITCHLAYVDGSGSPSVVSTSLIAMVGMSGVDLKIAVFEVLAAIEVAVRRRVSRIGWGLVHRNAVG